MFCFGGLLFVACVGVCRCGDVWSEWGLVERKCKWGSLGVGQMWVFWVVGGLGRVGVGGFEGLGLMS